MSAAAAIDHVYRYRFLSNAADSGLRLATSGGVAPNPYFFEGRVRRPREFGRLLLSVSEVVRSRWYQPMTAARKAAILDPVVTAHEEVLRLEGFSGCCGVYARADVGGDAFETNFVARGTTNVDFNDPMRAALARLRDGEDAAFAVGADEVRLSSESHGDVVERKVKLSLRWVKGFGEVQAYLARLHPCFTVSGSEFRRFLRTVPKSPMRRVAWVVRVGAGIRFSHRHERDAVAVDGAERLLVLDEAARDAREVQVWADHGSGVSAWRLALDTGAFTAVISPDPTRGFSGEGQLLSDLWAEGWEANLPRLQASLKWDAGIDAAEFGRRAGVGRDRVGGALAALAARGLVGFDMARGAYFHRELPFDLTKVADMHPRLVEARAMVAERKLRRIADTEWGVQGTEVEHRVRLLPEGDRCTCTWFVKHGGERGPCRHVLAARIASGDDA